MTDNEYELYEALKLLVFPCENHSDGDPERDRAFEVANTLISITEDREHP